MPLRIAEPRSSFPHNAEYVFSGRGGAGNYYHLPTPHAAAAATATSPSAAAGVNADHQSPRHHNRRPSMSNATTPLPSHPMARYATGRGGAGNLHVASERPMFFFDEELERMYARDEHAAPIFHIGRGGAGNTLAGPPTLANPVASADPRRSGESSRRSSNGSADSADSRGRLSGDEVWRRLSETLKRRS